MKGLLLRQLQSSGFMHRLMGEVALADAGVCRRVVRERCRSPLSSATGADYCTPAASFSTDGGVRGMATGAEIMCGSTKTQIQEKSKAEPRNMQSAGKRIDLEDIAKRPSGAISASRNTPDHYSKHQWWLPDPVTGTWVPQGCEGQVTTSSQSSKSPTRITRVRSEATASLEDKGWWTSMEELPDMDRERDR